jgi:fructose-1,6-bisphosphatase/sedoheptulose 1,7-bisphosphatase-like protein
MSDEELQDGEERHDDAPMAISEEDLGDDEMPAVETAVDGVLVGVDEDEEEDEVDLAFDPEDRDAF